MATTYTVAEAAAALGVRAQTVTKYIGRGQLAAETRMGLHGVHWAVTDLTVRRGADRLPPQRIVRWPAVIDHADLDIDIVLPEWRAADAWASGRDAGDG